MGKKNRIITKNQQMQTITVYTNGIRPCLPVILCPKSLSYTKARICSISEHHEQRKFYFKISIGLGEPKTCCFWESCSFLLDDRQRNWVNSFSFWPFYGNNMQILNVSLSLTFPMVNPLPLPCDIYQARPSPTHSRRPCFPKGNHGGL